MHLPHPLGITLCQIIVDRDDADALSLQRVQISRKRRDQRLSFSGFHLGDTSLMQYDSANDLYAIVLHAEGPHRRLADDRVCLRQEIIQRLAFFEAILKFLCLRF